MGVLLMFVLLPLPLWAQLTRDPGPGTTSTRAEVRNLDCARISEERAHELYPGIVPEPSARGSFIETSALACDNRIMQYGERAPRDEAILSTLSDAVGELTEHAAAVTPAAERATWVVDAFYPQPAIAAKIAFAAKTTLVGVGRTVSDRVPLLAAGDVLVLGRMPPQKSLPLACQRYFAEGSLGENDVLLGIALLDSRATVLNAGLCRRGEWRWLQ